MTYERDTFVGEPEAEMRDTFVPEGEPHREEEEEALKCAREGRGGRGGLSRLATN